MQIGAGCGEGATGLGETGRGEGVWENFRKSRREIIDLKNKRTWASPKKTERYKKSWKRIGIWKPKSRHIRWWVIAPFCLLVQIDSLVHSLIHLVAHLIICSQQTFFNSYSMLDTGKHLSSLKHLSSSRHCPFVQSIPKMPNMTTIAIPNSQVCMLLNFKTL